MAEEETLTDILLYHVLDSEVTSSKALTLLGDVTMGNGEKAGLKFFAGSIYVNDVSKVIIADEPTSALDVVVQLAAHG